MLAALKFVKGAVASKGFSPELTHFKIENGTIKGFNGKLALCSPIDLDITVAPKAIPFIKAITACNATTAMHITPGGKLSIKSGKFKAFIETVDELFPEVHPEGDKFPIKDTFIETLKQLIPFMAEDASRPWSRGVLLKGQSAYVTNNIIIIEAWMGKPFPVEVNIPATAVKELVRIKEDPTHMSMSDRTVTFYYDDGRWLRTNLNSTDNWPDVRPILDRKCEPQPVPKGFFEAIPDLIPFVGEFGALHFHEGTLCTDKNENEGASVVIEGLPKEGSFHGSQLGKLEGLVEAIDFTMYPLPCVFYGHNLRGAIIGLRE